MRLTGGSSHCDGRVEYFHRGQWRTVRNEYWNRKDAALVCRRLDCGSPLKLLELGPNTVETWINCNEMETTLTESLSRCSREQTIYAQSVLVGVFCTGKKNQISTHSIQGWGLLQHLLFCAS